MKSASVCVAGVVAALLLIAPAGATTPRQAASEAKAVIALIRNTPGCRGAIVSGAPGGLSAYADLKVVLAGGVKRSEVRRAVRLTDKLRTQFVRYC
jgi:enoyl-CoA hydratase/carnithine racemase